MCCAEMGEIKRIEALLGGKVSMPCDVTSSNSNDTLLLLVWYKGNKPFYSYDGRLLKHWRSGEFFQNDRIIFTFHTEPAALLMDRVNLDDEGTYRCRADFNLSPTRNSGIYLYVIIVPSKPFFMDEIGTKVEHTVGPFHEGDTLLLTCLAVGGKPIPKLTWWKSNTLLDSTDEPSEVPGVRENQLILTLTREFYNTKIQCLASNNNITVPLSSSLDIELYVSPKTVAILSSKQALSAGKLYELPCFVNGSNPTPEITWWLDGKLITDQNLFDKAFFSMNSNYIEQQFQITEATQREIISNLHLRPKVEHNGKDLTCRATNSVLAPSHAIAPLVSLTLLTDRNRDEHVREGDRLQFRCMVEANPWITNTEWFANSRTIQGSTFNGSQIILSYSDLLILNATMSHSGNYSCMAFNLEGSGRSNELQVKVAYKPRCMRLGVVRYENSTFVQCPISSYPEVTIFYWELESKPGKVFESDENFFNLDAIEGFVKVKQSDEIVMFCRASNSIGSQVVPCKLIVKLLSKLPDPPRDCSIDSSENYIIVDCILVCSADTNRSLDRLMSVSLWHKVNSTKILINNITSPMSRVKIDNLESGRTYELLLFSFNKWGESDVINLTANTLEAAYFFDRSSIDVGIWSGVLVGLILTISILIIILIMKKRMKSIIVDTGQNEKNDNATINRNDKKNYITSNVDVTEKPLLYKDGVTISPNILSMKINTEPKNPENISLVQMKGEELVSPPPVFRENKPRLPQMSNGSEKHMEMVNNIKKTKKTKQLFHATEKVLADEETTFKLFNMSKESIV
ncbi:cell adhesion molecule Dscam1-like [Arctopsyche grandis]|uniref:cell adhesion molecule Dscam1-like n=1 Tax=Arctopsyche grandis TaxID=121162 RepID=UPI00406D8255